LTSAAKADFVGSSDGTAEEAAEKVVSGQDLWPQRLKPRSKQCRYRSEALRHPKSRARSSFPAGCEAVPFQNVAARLKPRPFSSGWRYA